MNFARYVATLLVALPLTAQTPQSPSSPATTTQTAPPVGFTAAIRLWPDGAPGAHGTTDGDIPKLFTYPAAGAGAHTAVIVMPGGGYTHLVMEQEGAYEARWLAAHGVDAFVLEYRLAPAYLFPTAMVDAARAIRYVRAHAVEMSIDPAKVGVWGFSAGGHLSSYLATVHDAGRADAAEAIDRMSDRPDFEILSYGRFDMTVPLATGAIPMEAILGPNPSQAALDSIDTVKHVTADTSPTFIYSTTGDKTVDSLNASHFYDALKKAGVPVELHIFELGPHGTHMGEALAPALKELTITPILVANWMEQHGWMAEQPVAAEMSK